MRSLRPVLRWRRAALARAAGLALAMALTACLMASAAAAQTAKVDMTVHPQRVVEGDQATVEIVATGDYDAIEPPSSDGLDLTQTGRSSQVNIMGNEVRRSERLTFAGTPRRKGRFRIQGAVLRRNGQIVAQAPDHVIEVVDARASVGPALPPDQAAAATRYVGEPFFVRPLINVMRPFVGQPFVVGYDLYWSRNQNVSGLAAIGDPDYGDFAVEDLLAGKQTQQEAVRFAGEAYHHQLTRQVLLVATRPGKHEIIGPRYRVDVSNFFDARAYKVGPPVIGIDVRPLPTEGRPDDFVAGAVGKMQLDGWLLSRGKRTAALELATGERAVLAYAISGSGNLHGVRAIEPPKLDGMTVEALPGGASDEIDIGVNGPEGKRVWQFTVAFDRPGEFVIPARSASVFDPFDEAYVRSTAGPFTVKVSGEAIAPEAGPEAKGTAALAKPARALRPIAAVADLGRGAGRAAQLPTWVTPATGAPWALGLLWLLGLWGRRRARAAAPLARKLQALEHAREGLAAARAARDFGALRASVDGYLQTRLGLSAGGLTFAALRDALRAAGGPEDAVDALVGGLERCEQARFAPALVDAELDTVAAALEGGLETLDAATAARAAPRRAAGGPRPRALAWWLVGAAGVALQLAGHGATAATLDDAFAAANAAYVEGRLDDARTGYEALIAHGGRSPALHYNLAGVLVRQDQLGAALAHYRRALRLDPNDTLRADIEHNLAVARERLAEAARRRHRILHIFDEAPEASVALARAAPRVALGWLALFAGWAALAAALWASRAAGARRAFAGTAVTLLVVHVLALGWRLGAEHVLASARYAVIVTAEAPLEACLGVSEPLELPEGLEVRRLRERPDGRVEVRLPNGRVGCLGADALYDLPEQS